jgi:signal transduction histidine kinase
LAEERQRRRVAIEVHDRITQNLAFVKMKLGVLRASTASSSRFGLLSIRVRLEPLGGDMEVESKPGHGTRVTLVAPLKHNGGNKKEKVS